MHSRTWVDKYIRYPVNRIISPILSPLRLVLGIICFLMNALCVGILDLGTDASKPQGEFRACLISLSIRFYARICLFLCGFSLKVTDHRRNLVDKPLLLLPNHHGLVDVLVLASTEMKSIIAAESTVNNVLCRRYMRATRSLMPKGGTTQALKKRRLNPKWPAITAFAEGCISPKGGVLRPRTGVMRFLRSGDFV